MVRVCLKCLFQRKIDFALKLVLCDSKKSCRNGNHDVNRCNQTQRIRTSHKWNIIDSILNRGLHNRNWQIWIDLSKLSNRNMQIVSIDWCRLKASGICVFRILAYNLVFFRLQMIDVSFWMTVFLQRQWPIGRWVTRMQSDKWSYYRFEKLFLTVNFRLFQTV